MAKIERPAGNKILMLPKYARDYIAALEQRVACLQDLVDGEGLEMKPKKVNQ